LIVSFPGGSLAGEVATIVVSLGPDRALSQMIAHSARRSQALCALGIVCQVPGTLPLVPAKAGTQGRGLRLGVPGLASLARDTKSWIPAGVHPRESGGGNERSFSSARNVAYVPVGRCNAVFVRCRITHFERPAQPSATVRSNGGHVVGRPRR